MPPFTDDIFIIQGDEDNVVDPIDTIRYAEMNGIKLKIFEGTDHIYKKPGEKERIVAETEKYLTRDRLFEKAGRLIIAEETASLIRLQKAFKIGYTRSCLIMRQLCEAGVISEEPGNGMGRDVIMNLAEFEKILEKTNREE